MPRKKNIDSIIPYPAREALKQRGSQILAEEKTIAARAHGAMLKLIAWCERSREHSGPHSGHPDLITYIVNPRATTWW